MSQVESNMVPSIPLCTSGKDRSTTIDVPLRGFPLWFFTTMEDNLFSSELKDNFQQGLVLTVSAPSAFVATHVDTKIASTRGEEMFLGWYGNSTKLIKAMLKNASCPLVSVFFASTNHPTCPIDFYCFTSMYSKWFEVPLNRWLVSFCSWASLESSNCYRVDHITEKIFCFLNTACGLEN